MENNIKVSPSHELLEELKTAVFIATMTHQPRYTVFYQAMIKEEKPKEK